MANRYKDFSQLEKEELGKNHMPGTLGRHHYVILSQESSGIVVAGVSSHGETSKPLTVRPGGVLGYDLGRIWVIPPRTEMTPLQKLRSDFRIAKNNLHVISNWCMKRGGLPHYLRSTKLLSAMFYDTVLCTGALLGTYHATKQGNFIIFFGVELFRIKINYANA